jgi:hypothetical protein
MDNEDLRLAVYRSFAQHGGAPRVEDLAQLLTVDIETIQAALAELARARHLVIKDGQIVMAHPFSAVPVGFAVMGRRALWWGGCAWDSFALPHLLPEEDEVLVSTRCPACRRAHAWNVGTVQPPGGEQVAHFLVPASQMWNDVLHTCRHQRLFCSEDCVEAWCQATGNKRGYIMDLDTLWRFAAHWYDGRMDRGYVRREPAAAKGYLHSVGLSGAFWGIYEEEAEGRVAGSLRSGVVAGDGGDEVVWAVVGASGGAGDVGFPAGAVEADRGVAQGGHDGGSVAGSGLV